MKTSSPNMTSQIPNIRFQSRRGHFWFVFVKLSEIVGFSYLEHAKTNFESWFCFLLVWLMFLKRIFNKRKIVQISLHLTFTSRCFLPKTSFLDILEIFRLDMGQISSNVLKKAFALTACLSSINIALYDIFARTCTSSSRRYWSHTISSAYLSA